MNSQAAKELLDLIMLDDYVARKQALDDWSRRWLATMHVEFKWDGSRKLAPGALFEIVKSGQEELLRLVLKGLQEDRIHVLHWGKLPDDDNSIVLEMHCVMQKPRGT